jgi:hypothetical protein
VASRRIARILILSLFLLILTGCGVDMLPQSPTPLPSPTPTIKALATPTPTPEPTVAAAAEPTETPSVTPTPVPFPPRPEDFADLPIAIIGYLKDSQGDEDGLREMLKDWGALRNVTDLLRVDVDDDRQGELLLIMVDPIQEYGINRPGDLLVVDTHGQEYRLAYRASEDLVIMDPSILDVDDINGDGHTELAFTSTSCGAHTCFTAVYIIASGAGMYNDLTGGGIEMSYAEIYFSDSDGDGTPELVMYGGTIGSVGAGPQRARTEVYRWDGAAYTLSETIYDPSNYLYFKVLDANQALLDGEYERAATLYGEAIENSDLDIWMEEREREELTAFARYRLSLTYLILGETGEAQLARDELLAQQPGHIYAQVVRVLWDTYVIDGDLRAACEAVGSFAAAHPETAAVLADYGYSNPTFTTEEVCPITLF